MQRGWNSLRRRWRCWDGLPTDSLLSPVHVFSFQAHWSRSGPQSVSKVTAWCCCKPQRQGQWAFSYITPSLWIALPMSTGETRLFILSCLLPRQSAFVAAPNLSLSLSLSLSLCICALLFVLLMVCVSVCLKICLCPQTCTVNINILVLKSPICKRNGWLGIKHQVCGIF